MVQCRVRRTFASHFNFFFFVSYKAIYPSLLRSGTHPFEIARDPRRLNSAGVGAKHGRIEQNFRPWDPCCCYSRCISGQELLGSLRIETLYLI